MVELIVNTGGNPTYWQIVARAGLLNGAQLPNTVYGDLFFADQDWKNPSRPRYMESLKNHRPRIASVLDWEQPKQLNEVLSWAEDAAQYVQDAVIIIPKVVGGISELPKFVGGMPIRLGYSVETSHGKTPVNIDEFRGWENGIHLLGGNPLKQLDIAKDDTLDIRSIDCNYIMLKANKWCEFLSFKGYQHSMFGEGRRTTRWRQLKEIGLGGLKDAPARALELSCESLVCCWQFR